MIIAATGHRPPKIGGFKIPNPTYNYIREETRRILQEKQPEKAISGMALGFDTLFADVCVELEIPFIAAVPFRGQQNVWPQESRRKYAELLEKAVEVVIVSDGGYSPPKMQIRNEWMVNNSSVMLSCWDGSSGGTNNCVQYAYSQNKEVIIIDPKLWSVTNVENG